MSDCASCGKLRTELEEANAKVKDLRVVAGLTKKNKILLQQQALIRKQARELGELRLQVLARKIPLTEPPV